MKTALKPLANTKRDWQWPLLMAFIRLPLILAGSGLAILAYQLAGRPVGLAAGLAWSTLTLTIVNLLNLGLLVQRSHVEDFDLKKTLGFEWGRLGRDILIGIVFSLVLGGLLLIGVFGIVLLLYGADGFTKMETVFVGEADFSFTLPSWLALVSAVLAIIDRIGEMIGCIEAGEEFPTGDDSSLIEALAPGADGPAAPVAAAVAEWAAGLGR